MQSDYTLVMPFLVKALLDNRARYAEMATQEGEAALFAREPKAAGYLRSSAGYRLFEQREELYARLTQDVRENKDWLLDSLAYPLASS
jgi:deoxyhypusine synthase